MLAACPEKHAGATPFLPPSPRLARPAAAAAAAAVMVCAGAKAVGVLKFVGTVSLGLLTVRIRRLSPRAPPNSSLRAWPNSASVQGVSYTVSTLALPSLLQLPSSVSASQAISSLRGILRTPVRVLTAVAAAPLFLSFALSPRSARHPYLVYTSLLAVLSAAVPCLLPLPAPRAAAGRPAARKTSPRGRMDASYEVLGDVHSEPASEEDLDDMNGEKVRGDVERLAKGYVVRTGVAALGFAMAIVGIWGDGAPQATVYVS